ncbi:MAG: DNA polymerase III subunit delta' C-terminal domain-containing protein, partial [Hungatella sp.]
DEFQLMYQEVLGMLRRIKSLDISELLNYIHKLKEENLDLYECLDFMQLWYRDVLMFKVTKDANLLVFKDDYKTISEMSKMTGYDGFENILAAIDKARVRMDANVNMELAMELMLLAMKEN